MNLEDIPEAVGAWRRDPDTPALFIWDVPDDGLGWATESGVVCPRCDEEFTLVFPIDELMRPCPECGLCKISFSYEGGIAQ